ncbi:MAG: hypothetical protein ACRBHB_09680 [Arenicella sp.]
MSTITLNPEITKIAEQYFDENRDDFIQSLAQRLQQGIVRAEKEKANGEFMDLATFKQKLFAIDLTK